MKILITGISGFVGSHLKQELKNSGYKVFGIDRAKKNLTDFVCDLTDTQAVLSFFQKNSFDWVIHLAALTSVGDSWKNPELFLSVNLGMTKNIYQALELYNRSTKVLLVSTSDVYGPQTTFPITESTTPNPKNPYAESKRKQELFVLGQNKIQTIISRAFNHAGPGFSSMLAIPNFARQIALCEKGLQKEIGVGNLDSYRDYTDVRDVVRAYRLLIEKGKSGEIYNVCSGIKRQMKEILDMLLHFSSAAITVTQNPDLMRPSDVPEFWGSFQKIRLVTSWQPTITLEKTLLDTLDYWRNSNE